MSFKIVFSDTELFWKTLPTIVLSDLYNLAAGQNNDSGVDIKDENSEASDSDDCYTFKTQIYKI